MSNTPDSEAINFTGIAVANTPKADNPAFGAVILRLNRSQSSQTIRMTRADAERLADELMEYINRTGGCQ